ncbi:sensor histidine kinase [Arenibaculum pallidiluteum]|uniref:sensor histidine kinase n=1 Tax=Arenibaculum pallidiluteum TaxID=2812559 RepID=UPI001A960117|nr:HAMP domain-containing sensor histidine kinase [Arenibaculum pallidiluteum]
MAFPALVGLLVLLAEPLTADGVSFAEWVAREQVKPLLAESLLRDASGRLVLEPSPELAAYMAENPGFWFFAVDGMTKIEGGAARSLDIFDGDRVNSHGATFHLVSRGGHVGVLFGDHRGDLWAGICAWLADRLHRWLVALLVLAACTTLITVRLVRFLLRPVQRAAEAAAALTPGQPVPALPEAGVPAEILPLVTATNAALARLDQEHERQRRFIANAAHELRTPIAILGVRLDELPESSVKLALRHDVKRLVMLTNQLLDVERLHHGRADQRRPVDIVALAREVVAEMGPLAIGLGSTLSFETALPRLDLRGDEQALRGVFLNLVSNALTHGGANITVEVRVRDDGAVEVADDGIGVAADARDRVFEAFQRSGGGGGAGLGLYIVREVLRAHGASIELRDGQPGSVFLIRFPASCREAAAPGRAADATDLSAMAGQAL